MRNKTRRGKFILCLVNYPRHKTYDGVQLKRHILSSILDWKVNAKLHALDILPSKKMHRIYLLARKLSRSQKQFGSGDKEKIPCPC
jgi:hypothetical protein